MYKPLQQQHEYLFDGIPYIMEGQVVSIADPDQMGRAKVWIPSLDGENINYEDLPWARYASPFMGFTVEYPNGGVPVENTSHSAYGFWAIPKVGATVYVFFVNANPKARCYFASSPRLHRNRSLPAGRNRDIDNMPGPWGDAGDGEGHYEPIQPAFDNILQQFQGDVENSISQTRGAYERQVAQHKNDKDGAEGYVKNPIDNETLEPQTYCLVTPGRHAVIMQDHPTMSRVRVKTAEGHQIIMDDANERIYVSTAKGKSWFEMDLDGHIHMFSAQSISFRSGVDINFFADGNINFEANKSFNVKANEGDIKMNTGASMHINTKEKFMLAACQDIHFSGEANLYSTTLENTEFTSKSFKSTSKAATEFLARSFSVTAGMSINLLSGMGTKITAGTGIDMLGGTHIIESAAVIHLNGPLASPALPVLPATEAECSELADPPSIVPGHEPWPRPPSPNERGPNWKA